VNNLIEKAKKLRTEQQGDQALEILISALHEYPKDAEINYQIGWTYDASERSDQAILYYQKALEYGLAEDRVGCLLGLGSSLRAIGEYEQSRVILETAVRDFPQNLALKSFLSLTLYNLGKHEEATSLLIKLLGQTTVDPEIKAYQSALEYYADNLNETLSSTVT